MNKKDTRNLFSHTLVETGRQIKMFNLNMFNKEGFNITPEQFLILSILDDNSNLHQMQLCERLYKDRSNMARIIKVLENKGLVKKLQSIDKRVVNKIQITECGKTLKDLITPHIEKTRKKVLNNISEDELNQCINTLLRIQNNLKHHTHK